jgi:hypothetical protein
MGKGKGGNDVAFNSWTLLSYLILVLFCMYHHELWGDELHSWNIVKGSGSWSELFANIRYEGHPPFWYLVLYPVTRLSHSLLWLQAVQFLFTAAVAIVLLYYSPFSRIVKALLLCGYYFLYEYAVLARNYMPAVLFAFCIAAIFDKNFKGKTLLYYFLLLLLSQVHLIALMLAMAIHAAYIYENGKGKAAIHLIIGILIFISSVYFILPPSDSEMNFAFWKSLWTPDKFSFFKTVLVRSLLPMQDVNTAHWWNSNLILDRYNTGLLLYSLCIALLLLIWLAVYRSKAAMILVLTNIILTYILSVVFPLNTARYTGFIFIGVIAAAWLSYKDSAPLNRFFLLLILLVQIPAGLYAFSKDDSQKFSCAFAVKDMYRQIPAGSFVATDYWCLNNLSAFIDKPFYCLELGREISFLKWNSEMNAIRDYDYAGSLSKLATEHNGSFYLFSSHDSKWLLKNAKGTTGFSLEMVSSRTGSVENSGNVYLYLVSPL